MIKTVNDNLTTKEEYFKNSKKLKLGSEYLKIILAVLVVVFTTLIIISSRIVSRTISQNQLDEMISDLDDISSSVNLLIKSETIRVQHIIKDNRLLELVGNKDGLTTSLYLKDEVEGAEYLDSILIMDEQDFVWANSITDAVGLDYSAYNLFNTVLNSPGGLYVLGFGDRSPVSGNVCISVSKTIEVDGVTQGIIVCSFDITKFADEQVINRVYGKNGYPFIFDTNGKVMVHPIEDYVLSEHKDDADGVIPTILNTSDVSGQLEFEYLNTTMIAVYKKLNFIPWIVSSTIEESDLISSSNYLVKVILILSIILGAVILVLIYLFTNLRVIKRVSNLEQKLDKMSLGNLTIRTNSKYQDEIGSIAYSANRLSESFSTFLSSVKGGILGVKNSSKDMNDHITEAAASISQINSNIGNIGKLIEHQGESTQESAVAIEQLSRNIDSLNGQIEDQISSITESSAAVEEMTANISSISHTIKESSKDVNEMTFAADNGSKQLDQVLSLMSEIVTNSETLLAANDIISNMASQTNLLAMNAAIEAAHAGDAGKGFSVIADEIRKLAEESAEQSKTVGENLNSIKVAIDEVMNASDSTKQGFVEISSKVHRVNDVFTLIENSVQELNTGSSQILDGLKHMNEVSAMVGQGSIEMKTGNLQIIEAINQLKINSESTKTTANEITYGMDEINRAVKVIESLSSENINSVNEILELSREFKTE